MFQDAGAPVNACVASMHMVTAPAGGDGRMRPPPRPVGRCKRVNPDKAGALPWTRQPAYRSTPASDKMRLRRAHPAGSSIMYDLYIANKNYSSWSLRPWVLMRQQGIAFQERLMPFGSGPGREDFISPTGKVPCLVDSGTIVWDSLGITEYLAERHAGVWPAAADARAWARCATAEMHAGFATLRDICTMNCGIRVRLADLPDALATDIRRLDALWSEGLHRFGGPFLAGPSFTAVDAFFAPVGFRVQTYALPLAAAAAAYASRLLALAPMRDWYADALAETWRDEPHEAEARPAGPWLEDLRATSA
jgi:glutathione S-transferase